ncbi:hypothetical protein T484DRAFT_1979263 [Baffinella frigidus]|nr:hypothetical protein T484DRAFT_1979263 [Cryptophyta sp. CCMP2293]
MQAAGTADHSAGPPPRTPVRTISRLAVRMAPQGEGGALGDGDQLRFDDLRLKISALQEQLRASQNETELVAQQLKHCEFELAAAHRRPETESRATWTGYADTPSASGSDVDGPLMSAHETSATPGKGGNLGQKEVERRLRIAETHGSFLSGKVDELNGKLKESKEVNRLHQIRIGELTESIAAERSVCQRLLAAAQEGQGLEGEAEEAAAQEGAELLVLLETLVQGLRGEPSGSTEQPRTPAAAPATAFPETALPPSVAEAVAQWFPTPFQPRRQLRMGEAGSASSSRSKALSSSRARGPVDA